MKSTTFVAISFCVATVVDSFSPSATSTWFPWLTISSEKMYRLNTHFDQLTLSRRSSISAHRAMWSICSYKYQDIAIDIMPADDSSIGVSNIWYKPGFRYLQQIALEDGTNINILPSPYFLATKLEAFKDRGKNDFYGSHDFEDIIYLIDNRTTIVEEILTADEEIRQ